MYRNVATEMSPDRKVAYRKPSLYTTRLFTLE